jgi:hypothetical protein
VKAVLMLGAKRQDGTPYYPQTHFYKLPKDVLFLTLQYAVPDNSGKRWMVHHYLVSQFILSTTIKSVYK